MSRLELRVPRLYDMDYRRKLLAQPETMAYNRGKNLGVDTYDNETGCIQFPREDWRYWRSVWLLNEPDRFSALIRDTEQNCFVGEACYFYDMDLQAHGAGVLIEAAHRGKGYGAEALRLLIAHAFLQEEVACLFVELPSDNESAIRIYRAAGFHTVAEQDGVCLLKLPREIYERLQ